jgi:hypothetical protein
MNIYEGSTAVVEHKDKDQSAWLEIAEFFIFPQRTTGNEAPKRGYPLTPCWICTSHTVLSGPNLFLCHSKQQFGVYWGDATYKKGAGGRFLNVKRINSETVAHM